MVIVWHCTLNININFKVVYGGEFGVHIEALYLYSYFLRLKPVHRFEEAEVGVRKIYCTSLAWNAIAISKHFLRPEELLTLFSIHLIVLEDRLTRSHHNLCEFS